MSSRSIAFGRFVLPVLLAGALLSCSESRRGPEPAKFEIGDILKISYFRGLPDGKTKKPEPIYRVIMSESWRDRVGESPREPLAKGAPGKLYVGFLSDAEVASYFQKLQEFGIDKLKYRDPKEFNPEQFSRMAVHPTEGSFTRVFTIGTDKWARSYYYKDHHREETKDLIPIYTKCEAFVSRVCENSINVRTLTDPLQGKEK